MTIRKILTIPDPILRKKSLPVKNLNKEIKNLMDDMIKTMYGAPGIGLAAIQIGVPKELLSWMYLKTQIKKNQCISLIQK